MTELKQMALTGFDDQFLDWEIKEARVIIADILSKTQRPLVIQFSGGKDSMAMVGLARSVTNRFVLGFMRTGIDFPEAVEFAQESADQLGCELLISTPEDHLGGFFERLSQFRKFPTIKAQWCNRDLKVRPQQKMLRRILGKGDLYKLIGVRRYESIRRRGLYKIGEYIRPDNQVSGDFNVYPILNWTDADVLNYLKREGLPTSGLYKKYGVSGCYWCPFYSPEIYRSIMADFPHLYDEFIEWEKILNLPSVINNTYLGDIKE